MLILLVWLHFLNCIYDYNLQNRLSRVKKNGKVIAEFKYDADGMRIKAKEKLAEKQTKKTSYYVYKLKTKFQNNLTLFLVCLY